MVLCKTLKGDIVTMGDSDNGNGKLTFKWLVGILMSLLMAGGGLLIADTRESIKIAQGLASQLAKDNQYKIECLQKEKLDKDQYYRDMRDIKVSLEKINDKLDKIKR